MATIDIVKEVLVENLDVEADQVTEESSFETFGIDSLDMVELVSELEDRCDVELGDLAGVATVGQLVERIDAQQ